MEDNKPHDENKASETRSVRAGSQLQDVHEDGAKSPIKVLPSLIALAAILSYYGYSNKVKALLKQLSRVSIKYYENHQELLKGFVINDILVKHPFFGSKGKIDSLDDQRHKYFEWPSQEQYDAFPGSVNVQTLTFKAGNFKSLSGIKVHLTNGK